MQGVKQRVARAALVVLAVIAVGAAACTGCSAGPQIAKYAKTAQGQLGRVNVLIDQCAQGSVAPGSCAEAKGGVSAVSQSLADIEKAAK